MIRVMASSTTLDNIVTQEALKAWNYIYRQKVFKNNVQRGVKWQILLQNYLLRLAFNEKDEEENASYKNGISQQLSGRRTQRRLPKHQLNMDENLLKNKTNQEESNLGKIHNPSRI
jgi:hypothetical protein